MYRCRDCGIEKQLSAFSKDKSRKTGHFCYCKECASIRQKKWKRRNLKARRISHLRYMYGLSEEDYNAMLEEQGNCCKICKKKEPGHHGNFVVDHNHVTNEVRGLLCSNCNAGLGNFMDSINNLKAAVEYLKTCGAYGT